MRQHLPLTHFRNARFLLPLLSFTFFFLYTGHSTAETIRYVKAEGTGDGSSWAQLGDLQAMINASPAGHQIWVRPECINREVLAPRLVLGLHELPLRL